MTELTPAELPTVTDPIPFRAWAGDHTDDDGRAIDDTLEAAYAGPVDYEEPPAGKEEIKTTTRLMSRTVTLAAGTKAQLLPADHRRKNLTIVTANATHIRFSGDPGELPMAGVMGTAPVSIDAHTGAVWVDNVHESEDATVNVYVVTE